MNRGWLAVLMIVVGVSVATPNIFAQGNKPMTGLAPDAKPIQYSKQKPQADTPQAAAINLILAQEAEKTDEIASLISTNYPGWMKTSALKRDPDKDKHGPINMTTLKYQLKAYTPEKAEVSITYNRKDGLFTDASCCVIRENGKWVRSSRR